MLEIKWIRNNIEEVKAFLVNRNNDFDVDRIVILDEEKRSLLTETENLKAQRNEGSRKVAEAKASGQDADVLMEEMKNLGQMVKENDSKIAEIDQELQSLLLQMPNRPHDSVPVGKDENDNMEVRKWGTPKEFVFEPQAHWDIGEKLGILDFEKGVSLAESRFTVLKGAGARLEPGGAGGFGLPFV